MPPEVHWSSQRPTIMDVANLSGVSKSTVSNVLRGAGRVSDGTRGRVLESIEALGYRPNSLARDLVRRRSNTIGVVLGDLANTFYADLVKLLELRISEAAYTTIVCNTDGRLERERARVEMLLERAVSGVVMLQFGGDGSVLDELALARVPGRRHQLLGRARRLRRRRRPRGDGRRGRAPPRARAPPHRARHQPPRRGQHPRGALRRLRARDAQPRARAGAARRRRVDRRGGADRVRRGQRRHRDRADRPARGGRPAGARPTCRSSASTAPTWARTRGSP